MGALLLAVPALAEDKGKAPEEDPEVRLGRENAALNDQQVKLVADAALNERVNAIGQELARIANSERVPATWGSSELKQFAYTFKIVDDKDVNAYSLPGGFIYVNRGLLDYVKSDDELAGVLAHEVAHAAHHHMMKLISEQNKLQRSLLLPLLVGVIFSKSGSESVGGWLMAGQLYMVAKLNSYGVEAEKDSDQTAIRYLVKSRFNPVGLLTFMERLARDELRGPERVLGIYRTHPPSPERARALLDQLEALRIPITRRETDPSLSTRVEQMTLNGRDVVEVRYNKTVVARLASSGGLSAAERGRRFSETLNRLMDQNLQMHELRLGPTRTNVIARNQVLLSISPDDAEAQGRPAAEIASTALEAIRNLLWQDQFNRVPASAAGRE